MTQISQNIYHGSQLMQFTKNMSNPSAQIRPFYFLFIFKQFKIFLYPYVFHSDQN